MKSCPCRADQAIWPVDQRSRAVAVPVTASDSFVNRSSVVCREVDKNIASEQGKLHAESRSEKASKKPIFPVVSVDCLWITVWKGSQTASGCGPLADQVAVAPMTIF